MKTEHEFETVSRLKMKKGYQDQMYESSETYLTCSCGWERPLWESGVGIEGRVEVRLLRLEHLAGIAG